MSLQLEIVAISKDPNGLISAKFKIHDPANGEGAIEKFTVGALEIAQRYGGDVQRWITEAVAPGMKANHAQRTAVHNNLSALRGKRINI